MASFAKQSSPMLLRQLSDSSQAIARNSTNNIRTATALLIQISQAHRDGSIDTYIKNYCKSLVVGGNFDGAHSALEQLRTSNTGTDSAGNIPARLMSSEEEMDVNAIPAHLMPSEEEMDLNRFYGQEGWTLGDMGEAIADRRDDIEHLPIATNVHRIDENKHHSLPSAQPLWAAQPTKKSQKLLREEKKRAENYLLWKNQKAKKDKKQPSKRVAPNNNQSIRWRAAERIFDLIQHSRGGKVPASQLGGDPVIKQAVLEWAAASCGRRIEKPKISEWITGSKECTELGITWRQEYSENRRVVVGSQYVCLPGFTPPRGGGGGAGGGDGGRDDRKGGGGGGGGYHGGGGGGGGGGGVRPSSKSKMLTFTLLYFPRGAQSKKDHLTVDQYRVAEKDIRLFQHTLKETIRDYQMEKYWKPKKGDFEVKFQGDSALHNQQDLVKNPKFKTPEQTIETFRQRAQRNQDVPPGSFDGYNPRGVVTGEFGSSKVALASCQAVGALRFHVEQNEFLNKHRTKNMPRGAFVCHMTMGTRLDKWSTAMERLGRNMDLHDLGSEGGTIVLSRTLSHGSYQQMTMLEISNPCHSRGQPKPRPRQPRPHQPRPRQPRPHQPRPRQPRPYQPRPRQPRPRQPRPHQPRPHQPRHMQQGGRRNRAARPPPQQHTYRQQPMPMVQMAQQQSNGTYYVTVPNGVAPGANFVIQIDGDQFQVQCPYPYGRAGDVMEVRF